MSEFDFSHDATDGKIYVGTDIVGEIRYVSETNKWEFHSENGSSIKIVTDTYEDLVKLLQRIYV